MRRFLAASVACGVVITGGTIASAVVLAQSSPASITDPATRTVAHWAGQLWILVALWMLARSLTVAGQAVQRGATAVIADRPRVLTRSARCRRGDSPRFGTMPPSLSPGASTAAALLHRYLPAVFLAGHPHARRGGRHRGL